MGISLTWLDVPGIAANALWIVGLAVLLSVWSWATYEASTKHQKVSARLESFPNSVWLDGGWLLFSAGLLATEHRWWARIIWGVWMLWFGGHAIWTWRQRRREGVSGHS